MLEQYLTHLRFFSAVDRSAVVVTRNPIFGQMIHRSGTMLDVRIELKNLSEAVAI